MRTRWSLILSVVLLSLAAAAAAPPGLIHYQGVLRSEDGDPLSGNFPMVFRFFDDPGAGTLLLTDTHDTGAPSGRVGVDSGLFTAQLGAGTVSAGSEGDLAEVFRDNAAVWLEVQVGAETLSPRVRVLASAYAQNAGTLDGNEASAFAAAVHMQAASAGGTGIDTSAAQAGNLLTTSGTGTWSTLAAGSSGQLLQSSGGGVSWVDPGPTTSDDGDWTISGSDLYSAVSGNVGIGTASPGSRLSVVGNASISGNVGAGTQAPEGKLHVVGPLCIDTFADEALDQEQLDHGSIFGGAAGVWQSFTPGLSGLLTRISVALRSPLSSGVPVVSTLNIYSGEGIEGTLLCTQSVTLTGGYSMHSFAIADPPPISSGSQYTFQVIPGTRDRYYAYDVFGDLYAGGRDSGGVNWDLKFQTFTASGTASRALTIGNAGVVRIGTATPGPKLEVLGDARITGALRDSSGDAGSAGQVLQSTGSGTDWVDPSAIKDGGRTVSGIGMYSAVSGGVSIGTDSPYTELDAQGRVRGATADAAVDRADACQTVRHFGPTVQRLPAIETVSPGDVLVMIPENGEELYPCALAADPAVVGIAGEGTPLSEEGAVREIPVVLGGITLCKVDAAYGPIRKSDLLVTSPTPGHAMKAQPEMVNGVPIYRSGTLIGKALENLDAGTGTIRVLVMLR